MFKNILVPIDGSEFSRAALHYALHLGAAYQSRLVLLAVIDVRQLQGPFIQEMAAAGGAGLSVHMAALSDWLEKRARSQLAALRPECDSRGMLCESRIVTGIVAQQIIEQAKTCDMVVMGKHGENYSFRGPLLGSTVESVVRGTVRPVVVTPGTFAPVKRILVPYDGSQYASGALTAAANLATALGLELVLLTVDRDSDRGQQTIARARQYLEGYKLDVRDRVTAGEASERILATCTAEECSMIAMGAWGHSPIRELVMGSTTARAMRGAACPVLLFR